MCKNTKGEMKDKIEKISQKKRAKRKSNGQKHFNDRINPRYPTTV